jgi:hypothetical protein
MTLEEDKARFIDRLQQLIDEVKNSDVRAVICISKIKGDVRPAPHINAGIAEFAGFVKAPYEKVMLTGVMKECVDQFFREELRKLNVGVNVLNIDPRVICDTCPKKGECKNSCGFRGG